MSPQKITDSTAISISELSELCNTFLQSLTSSGKPINYHRSEILKQCLKAAKSKQGLFSLTVPTGGGKTYSSLAFALNHALIHNLDRIIYVIPYTSIIEQTAQIFKNMFGAEHVLEHHSNYQYEKKDEENADSSENNQNIEDKIKSASENWDIPIVVTTNVQFFESLFANRNSKCRKLHNISKSVIVFDEAQMLPHEYIKPCLAAVAELVHNYKATALLCTATQPSINRFLPAGIAPSEIIQDPVKLYEIFKKVRIVNRGIMDDETLIRELNALESVLCIVNTKKHAKEIYKGFTGNCFYLSTLMCPVHRKEVIKKIKESLKNNISCKVVSTQLIEAGVDIDFPVVYRSLAGIDSIIQSAGRCNREGNVPSADVHVFESNSKYGMTRGYLQRTARVANEVLRKFDDPISIEAINCYFDLLYDVEGDDEFDKKEIMSCFNKTLIEFDFETAAKKFKLIESNTCPVLIPYDENAKMLIESLRFSKYPQSLMRKLQPYTVSVYENQLRSLSGSLDIIKDCYYVLSNAATDYDPHVGLIVPEDPNGEAIFV